MATPTTYSYTKAVDIPRLSQEIASSGIVTVLDHMNLTGTALDVAFKDVLSDPDKTTLDAVVAAHVNTPLALNAPVIGINSTPAFAAKTVTINGVTKNLYKRFTGISQVLAIGPNTFTWSQSTFPWVKFKGLEVIGGEIGDTCDLYVLDTPTGTYSGVPNYPLNRFAYAANIAPEFYKHESEYDADMYQNLQIKIIYTSVTAKTIYINFDMNEVK